MVRDFGIMIFQDFLLLVCVYLFLMPLHVMEKKKIKNGLIPVSYTHLTLPTIA